MRAPLFDHATFDLLLPYKHRGETFSRKLEMHRARLYACSAKFQTKGRKSDAESRGNCEPDDQKRRVVVVSDEITVRQIRGPPSSVNLSHGGTCKNALCRRRSRNRERAAARREEKVDLSMSNRIAEAGGLMEAARPREPRIAEIRPKIF